MLILPPGHAQDVQTLRRLTSRERRLLAGILVVVAALAVGIVISIATAGSTSAHGCIHLTVPGPVGASAIDECGATARSTCASVFEPGAYAQDARRDLAAACRKAGLAVR